MNPPDPIAEGGQRPQGAQSLLETADLAGALENDRFKQFLDHIPVGIVVADLQPFERIVYANLEFERLTAQVAQSIWTTCTRRASPW